MPAEPGRLQVVDGSRAELDRQSDRSRLGELIAVESQRQAGRGTRLQVPTCLRSVERSSFEEDVGRFGERRGLWQDIRDQELDVRVCVGELGRHRVRAEPGGNAARSTYCPELRKLRVVVEPVAGLRLERRRPVGAHARAMTLRDARELVFARRAGGADRREDAAAGGVKLLVGRPTGAQRELVDTVSREAGVRMAVDEAGNRTEAAPVDLGHVGSRHLLELGHRPDARDAAIAAENVRVLDDPDVAKTGTAQRPAVAPRGRHLGEVADEQGGHAGSSDPGRVPAAGGSALGRSRAPSRAASSAAS